MISKSLYKINLNAAILIFSILFVIPLSADKAEDQQILHGMVSVVTSMDAYMKGVYDYLGLVGENSEVNADLYLCKTIALAQYPSKADGYLKFYSKTGFPEYKTLSQQFIDKMYKVYTSTKTKDGKNWLPTQSFIADDGKFYGYGQGMNFTRFTKNPIPFDQSKGKFQIEGASFEDAWGIGMLELAKETGSLDIEYKDKVIKLLIGMADFWNDNDYMKYRSKGAFLLRTEDVFPLKPKTQTEEPKWGCMGADFIWSVLALNELKQDISKYDNNLMLFLNTYVNERVEHSHDKRIDYLDNRVIHLAKYFESRKKYEKLTNWVLDKLPNLYVKKMKKAVFMLSGSVEDNSTIPLLDLYVQMDLKKNYKALWDDIWKNGFSEKGIIYKGQPVTINNSGYVLLLDAGYQGWLKGFISDKEFVESVKRYYSFKGNPENYRDLNDWVIETEEWDRVNPGWAATPFDCFPPMSESEAYYDGKPQGYTVHRILLSKDTKEANKKENQFRDCYYQFAAPFQNHAEKIRYGLAQTFNVLKTESDFKLESLSSMANPSLIVNYVEPNVPKGMPCVGYIDVTDIYYKDKKQYRKEGLEIYDVLQDGKRIPFYLSHFQDYKVLFGGSANSKLSFIVPAIGNNSKGKITVLFRNKKFPYFIEGADLKLEVKKDRKDLPVAEKQGMECVVDNYMLPDSLKWLLENKGNPDIFVDDTERCLLAYRANYEKTEQIIVSLVNGIDAELQSDSKKTSNSVFLGKYLNALTRISFIWESDRTKINEIAAKVSRLIADGNLEPSLDSLIALMRYGILFEDEKLFNFAQKGLDSWIIGNINEEGFNIKKDNIVTVSKLVGVLRLAKLNGVQITESMNKTTENMLELLMYCSGPDGMIPSSIDNSPKNVREILYWGGSIFKRADFLYVAFGGLKMANSAEPSKTSIAYEKSGIYILRTNWNIRDRASMLSSDEEEMLEDRSACLVLSDNKLVVSGFSGELFTLKTGESKSKVEFAIAEKCVTLKTADFEIKLFQPKYAYLNLLNNCDIACPTANLLKGSIVTHFTNFEKFNVELRDYRGKGELELIPMKENNIIDESGSLTLKKGEYFINFFGDWRRKRTRYAMIAGQKMALSDVKKDKVLVESLKGKDIISEKYCPETLLVIKSNLIELDNFDESAKIVLNEDISKINIEITKRDFLSMKLRSKGVK